MKELLKGPGFMGTAATLGADLSQVMAMLFTGLFIIGWFQARKKMGNAHHRLVLGGMVAMLAFFTSYYLFRQLGVLAFEGKEGFGGSDFMYHQVFIPLLTFHITLVSVGLIMAIYMIILGFRAQQLVAGKRELMPGELKVGQEKLTKVFVVSGAVLLVLYVVSRSEEHTSELQSQFHLVCRLLLEKKKHKKFYSAVTCSTTVAAAWNCSTTY